MIPKKVIVMGGGFAGLAAASALAEKGVQVTVIEGRQVLGGRAFSFTDPKTGDSVDNGQHLFMGCYRQTRVFLERIGTFQRIDFQQNLSVDFVGSEGRHSKLRCWPLPAPLHLFSGLLGLSSLSWGDRLRLLPMRKALKSAAQNPAPLQHITVEQWLKQWNQSDRARRNLWDPIAIATLNENPDVAAAGPFAEVLRQAFFEGREASELGLSTVGLSDLYTHAARSFIERRGGEVLLKSPVDRLVIGEGRVSGVSLREGGLREADVVISAIPAPALLKLLPVKMVQEEPVFERMKNLKAAPIISIHLWFDRAISARVFAGMLDTHCQWFFNKSKITARPKTKEGYVSVVISGAHRFVDWTDTRLLTLALEELRRVFPQTRGVALIRSLVIKEHQATLSPGVGSEAWRPAHQSPVPGLFLAGDWTQTGLPATIESACLSGHACAELILQTPVSLAEPVGETAHV